MSGARTKRRTRIVPQIVFRTALSGVVPAVAVACGGSVTGGDARGDGVGGASGMTGGAGGVPNIIALAVAGFGPTGGNGAGGRDIIVLAVGGYGNSPPYTGGVANTGGYGYGGGYIIALAVAGYGPYYPTGGYGGTTVDAGSPDAMTGGDAGPVGDAAPVEGGADASGPGPIVLAVNGFGTSSDPSRRRL